MVDNNLAQNAVIMDFLKMGALGTGTGFIADAVVEAGRIPYFNDPSQAADPKSPSNFEVAAYGAAGLLTIAGLVDFATNKKPLGIAQWALPFGIGLGVGVMEYELWGATKIGIRPQA